MTNVAVIYLIMNGYDDKINKYIYIKETIASICKTKKLKDYQINLKKEILMVIYILQNKGGMIV